jgi:4-hydroxythreonine-4-phosphate dehydrogenase
MNGATLALAVTLGDPRGIGPEVAAAAARRLRDSPARPRLIFIGPADSPAALAGDDFIATAGRAQTRDPAEAGAAAAAAIERAAALALAGSVAGIVTSPIDKAALHAAGVDYPGHTEYLAALAGVEEPVMMMAAESTALGGALRVVLATTHLPLAGVPAAFTLERLIAQAEATDRGLRAGWGIAAPRLALCAFNPHASDGGRFGDEEARIYAPALVKLRERGVDAHGPIPADTVFLRALRGEFDAVIAPYHDVGMAAFKTAAFGHGVNVTLGLPFIRTSPDHGTAIDIAGTGRADAGSMVEAIRLAGRLAGRRPSKDLAPDR